jgi:hypothetical protein
MFRFLRSAREKPMSATIRLVALCAGLLLTTEAMASTREPPTTQTFSAE